MMSENEKSERQKMYDKGFYLLLRMIDSNHGPLVILLLFVLAMFLGSLWLIPAETRVDWLKALAANHVVGTLGWGLALIQPPIYLWLRNVSRKVDEAEIKRLNEANERFVQMELNLNLAAPKPKP